MPNMPLHPQSSALSLNERFVGSNQMSPSSSTTRSFNPVPFLCRCEQHLSHIVRAHNSDNQVAHPSSTTNVSHRCHLMLKSCSSLCTAAAGPRTFFHINRIDDLPLSSQNIVMFPIVFCTCCSSMLVPRNAGPRSQARTPPRASWCPRRNSVTYANSYPLLAQLSFYFSKAPRLWCVSTACSKPS